MQFFIFILTLYTTVVFMEKGVLNVHLLGPNKKMF